MAKALDRRSLHVRHDRTCPEPVRRRSSGRAIRADLAEKLELFNLCPVERAHGPAGRRAPRARGRGWDLSTDAIHGSDREPACAMPASTIRMRVAFPARDSGPRQVLTTDTFRSIPSSFRSSASCSRSVWGCSRPPRPGPRPERVRATPAHSSPTSATWRTSSSRRMAGCATARHAGSLRRKVDRPVTRSQFGRLSGTARSDRDRGSLASAPAAASSPLSLALRRDVVAISAADDRRCAGVLSAPASRDGPDRLSHVVDL